MLSGFWRIGVSGDSCLARTARATGGEGAEAKQIPMLF